ncbi:MAG TPA: hypothetical protein VGV59_11865 [Pyrinomonadaceae bacterium]|nr:hypothetical protein [Pyrinomonadaceae bacterium]
MALFEGKTPAERNKMIAAVVLGLLALIFMWRMLFGGTTKKTSTNAKATASPSRAPGTGPLSQTPEPDQSLIPPTKVVYTRVDPGSAEAGRNIFAFYVKPQPAPKPSTEELPPATPTPTPPLMLSSLSTQSVFARTGDFPLQVSGDKFTPAVRIYIDGQELQTQVASGQQASATVPASVIASPGARQVQVRTPDGQLYSNSITLNVMQPPAPTMTFVGFIGRAGYKNETAVLKNPKNELLSVKLNDLVEGRFRVTNISDRMVELTDKDLKIKHTLPYVEGSRAGAPPPGYRPPQPPPKTDDEGGDEEP